MKYNFIGETLEDVIKECDLKDLDYRITMIDNEPQNIQRSNPNPLRYNFEVDSGLVIHSYKG